MCVLPSRFSSSYLIRTWVMVLAVCSMHAVTAQAQFFPPFGGGFGFVGGVRIDTEGVLRNMSFEEQQQQLDMIRRNAVVPKGQLEAASPLRCISLKKVQEAVLEIGRAHV